MKHPLRVLTAAAAALCIALALTPSPASATTGHATTTYVQPAILDTTSARLTLSAIVAWEAAPGLYYGAESGRVRFYVGNTLLCAAPPFTVETPGHAECGGAVAALRTVAGPLSYRAVYSGGEGFLASAGTGPSIQILDARVL